MKDVVWQQKAPDFSEALILNSRDDWTRTSDPLHPMQVRYRAAPHPDFFAVRPPVNIAWVWVSLLGIANVPINWNL